MRSATSQIAANALDTPRHPHQEIADLLAVALLRQRVATKRLKDAVESGANEPFQLDTRGIPSVNATPNAKRGARK